jgi:antitoxin component of RelBE/YafQ-DinJ toxin-antitoxin module
VADAARMLLARIAEEQAQPFDVLALNAETITSPKARQILE